MYASKNKNNSVSLYVPASKYHEREDYLKYNVKKFKSKV